MFARFLLAGFNDAARADNRRPHRAEGGDPTCPAVFGRATIRFFALLGIAAIVYGSLVPFEVALGRTWNWRLGWHPLVVGDAVANVLIYVPVGLFARLLYRRRGSHWLGEMTFALLAVAALSYFTEAYQTILVRRVACWADVGCNTAGGLFGALLAPLFQRILRNQHAWLYRELRTHPFNAVAFTALAALAVYALLPFDIRPTPAQAERAWRELTTTPLTAPWVSAADPTRPLAPLQVFDKLAAAAAYGILALLLLLAAREKGAREKGVRSRFWGGFRGTAEAQATEKIPGTFASAGYALTRSMMVVATIEALQFFTLSHAADARDLLLGWAFCGLGAGGGSVVLARTGGRLPQPRAVLRGLVLAAVLMVAARTLVAIGGSGAGDLLIAPAERIFGGGAQPAPVFAPMAAVFHRPWEALLADYTAAGLQYAAAALIAVLALRACRKRPMRRLIFGASLAAAVLAQTWAACTGHPIDSAHLLLALLAGWIILRADRAVFPHPLATPPPSATVPHCSST